MKSEIILNLRQFPVLAHDHRTGKEEAITVTVAKNQLQAAQIVGQSSKELIERLCERQGYSPVEIGRPVKRALVIDLGQELLIQEEVKSYMNAHEEAEG